MTLAQSRSPHLVSSGRAQAQRRESLLRRLRRGKVLYLMLAIPVLWYIIFAYVPMVGLTISFQDYSLFRGPFHSTWIGLGNFVRLFNDPSFWRVVGNTVILGTLATAINLPLPIILALLLNELKEGVFKRLAQSISYLPYFVSTVALVNIVTVMLSPSTGVINLALKALTGHTINFMVEQDWFRPLYIMVIAWAGTGWTSIIYLAAMAGIDPELYQAAEVDGANRVQRMWHVTLPGISATITTIFLLSLPGLIASNFEVVLLLQLPVTYATSDVIGTYVYRRGLVSNEFGYAAAVSLLFSLASVAIIYVSNWLARRHSETSLW